MSNFLYSSPVPQVKRDRVTFLAYAQLGGWGFFLYGFSPLIPLLRDEQGTSAAVAGLHGTAMAVGGVLGGLLFTPLVRRLGRGRTTWLGLGGLAAAVTLLCLLRPFGATLTVALLGALGGTLVASGVAAVITERHGKVASAAISEAYAVSIAVGLLAPLATGFTARQWDNWRIGLVLILLLIGLVAVVAAVTGARLPDSDASARAQGASRRRLPRPYWLAWLLLVVVGAIEACVAFWSASVLRTHAGVSAATATTLISAMVFGKLIGRVAGSAIAARVSTVSLVLSAFALSATGFVVFWTSTVGWLAGAGLLVIGLGNAMHFPLVLSLAMSAAPGAADRAAAVANYANSLAFAVAPVALGGLADLFGPHRAFLLLPALLAAAALLAVSTGRMLRSPDVEPVR